MESGKQKIYLELDAFELGQILALLPYSSYSRMDKTLRKKIDHAKSEIESDREPAPTPNPPDLPEPEAADPPQEASNDEDLFT